MIIRISKDQVVKTTDDGYLYIALPDGYERPIVARKPVVMKRSELKELFKNDEATYRNIMRDPSCDFYVKIGKTTYINRKRFRKWLERNEQYAAWLDNDR